MAIILSFNTGKPINPVPPPPAVPAPKKSTAKRQAKKERYQPEPRKHDGQQAENRKFMLSKIHLAKAGLGMSDDEYHNMLDDLYACQSAADLDDKQLHNLLLHFQRLGFEFKRGSKGRKGKRKLVPSTLEHDPTDQCREPYIKKIEALLTEKGAAEGTHVPWGYAVGILKHQTRGAIKSLDQANVEQLTKVIAALTYDAKRKRRYSGSWGS